MSENLLGKNTEYNAPYDPSILFPVPRVFQRKTNNININNFIGYDVWNAYEFSYLNNKGKPECKILRLVFNADTEFIIESKSLKLYLNSFSMMKFSSDKEILELLKKDLIDLLKTENLKLFLINNNKKFKFSKIPQKQLLDNIDIETETYNYNSELLKSNKIKNKKTIERYSNLFRSNCPITNQPDWATIYIKCKSDQIIDDTSLLKYFISFRNHQGYHESCCEIIYNDIFNLICPEYLEVKCFFTRRGGIDINPFRFSRDIKNNYDFHFWRQ